ncbi:hypothetical protein YQE_06347, partial [Dendroctonus ponderosae]
MLVSAFKKTNSRRFVFVSVLVDCYSHEFQCSNGHCVDNRLRCNGRPDCSDYSDESNCVTTTQEPITLPPATVSPRSCPFGYVSCLSGDQCVLRSQLCDGRVNCPDASDESNCDAGYVQYSPPQCQIQIQAVC